MKILVVGGNGFIGSHLVDRLVENQCEVAVLDLHERRFDPLPPKVCFIRGDLTQAYLVREALTGVDTVIHLAWASIHESSNQDPASDVNANLVPTLRLIEACTQTDVRRFVFASSGGTIYGPPNSLPIYEEHPQNPINVYGIHKLSVEKYLQMFHYLKGLDYTVLRPSVPYGPRQNPLGRQGAVAVFMYRVSHGLPLEIWGDGTTSRDYFYVSDLVKAFVASLNPPPGAEKIFNIGGSEEITLNSLIRHIEDIVEKKAVVNYQPARKFDVSRLILNTDRAAKTLQWQPTIDIQEGLKHTWKWMSKRFG